jgi:heme-degrading monooxygenase HmoA
MIARIWHGVTPTIKSDEYFSYVNRTGVPAYQSTEGNLGVYVLRKIEGDQAHFLLVSFWDSLDSIAKFFWL